MPPAQERFEAGYRTGAQIDTRVVFDLKFVVRQRGGEIDFQFLAGDQPFFHLRLEEQIGDATAGVLGRVERDIRRLDERVGVPAIARTQRDPDAYFDLHRIAADRVGGCVTRS